MAITKLEKDLKLYQDPELLSKICKHVASGGTVITLADLYQVPYGELMGWIRLDQDRSKAYELALKDRQEWLFERTMQELMAIATHDIKDIFDEDGRLKPIEQWPDATRAAVAGFEVEELYASKGSDRVQSGWNKKVKLADKLRALELIGRNLGAWKDKVEHSGSLTLEDIISAANDVTPKDSK